MKRRFEQIRTGGLFPSSLVSSSSSDDLSGLEDYRSTGASFDDTELARSVRARTQAVQTAGSAASYPPTYTSNLQEILTRYHNWSNAVTAGNTGASAKALSQLQHRVACKGDKEKHVCTLCLENVEEGDEYTTLACGHVFHKGSAHKFQNLTTAETLAAATDGSTKESCRGILYWLRSNLTCPHCRLGMEPAVPVPSASEQVIVPLLNRQFALIQAQARLIERQRRDLQAVQRNFQTLQQHSTSARRRRVKQSSAMPHLCLPSSMASEPIRPLSDANLPARTQPQGRQWQNGVEHHVHRVHILNRVTKIAGSALNWRLVGCSVTKIRKLNTLAAKVELLLFSEAASLEEYKNMATLRKRVLKKIKGLICKAKALRRVRHANPVAPMGSLVF